MSPYLNIHAVTLYQKYTRDWALSISPTPLLIFTGGGKVQNLSLILDRCEF